MRLSQINNSDPRAIALGFFFAVVCGILGAIVVIHFRDIAGRDDRRFDRSTPQHAGAGGGYAVGGYMCLLLCVALGCASFFLLEEAPRRTRLVRQVSDAFEVYSPKGSSQDSMQQMSTPVYSDKWVNHQWAADEAPYRKIRHDVDAQVSADKDSVGVAEQAMEAAFGNSNNPLAMYRWGYAAYKLAYQACYHSTAVQPNEIVQGGDQNARQAAIAQTFNDADYQMQQVANPKGYSYSRLIFLLRAMREFTKQYVPPAESADIWQGEYLIAHKPDDWDVKEALARMLATHRNVDYKKRALQYANEVVRTRPTSPQAWQTLGITYISIATLSRRSRGDDVDYAAKAIAAYQKCLRLAPPDYGPRESLERAIPTIGRHPRFLMRGTV